MIIIDKLCYTSKLRHVNAEEKFMFSLITLLICVISRSLPAAGLVLLVNGVLNVKKGGIPFFRYLRLLMIPLMFLLLSTLAVIVNVSGTPMNAYAVPVGSVYITGSWESIYMGIRLILTALAAVSCLYFLSLNTPMTEILEVLKKMHCPSIFIELMMLTYRFIFILMEVASSIMTAQKARLGNRDFKTAVRSFGEMASVLLVRALKRANALYDAMVSRCYDGKICVLKEGTPPKLREILWILLYECILILVASGRYWL